MARSLERKPALRLNIYPSLRLDEGSRVQPMKLLRAALAGRPYSCRPNLRGTVKRSQYPPPHGRYKLTRQKDGTKLTELDESFNNLEYVPRRGHGGHSAKSTVHTLVHRSVHLEGTEATSTPRVAHLTAPHLDVGKI